MLCMTTVEVSKELYMTRSVIVVRGDDESPTVTSLVMTKESL